MYKTAILILLIHLFNTIHTEAFHDENDTVPPSAHLLSRYIRHASVTGNERMAGLFFSTVARQKGFHVEILKDEPASFNFTASLYPLEKGKPNIVLLNHIDVVPATREAEQEYTYPPFSGTIADGKVWGRGAIDNKGMGVMQILAMEKFLELAAETDLPFNVTMPSVSVAFKLSLWLELNLINITSGHGAVPPPDYVLKEKTKALNRLLERNERVRFSETTRNMFRELGRIEGGQSKVPHLRNDRDMADTLISYL